MKIKKLLTITLSFVTAMIMAQEEENIQKSNIQEYTPSKLLKKGQWDIKLFNNLYTQTEHTDSRSASVTVDRSTFFTSTLEVFTGMSESRRWNIGVVLQAKSNTYGGAGALEVLNFENDKVTTRSGLTSIAPSVKVQPFKSVSNFSFQTSLHIPLFKDVPNAPYLDKKSFIWETKFFYDKPFAKDKFQFFGEVDTAFNFGKNGSDLNPTTNNISEHFANNSLFLPVSAFISYFPSSKFTVYTNVQQAFLIDLGNDFAQNYTLIGLGSKYQLTKTLNIETSVGKFIRGNNFQGLGQTFNLGLRALF